MLKSIKNSFKVQNLLSFFFFFCIFLVEGTLQQTKCAATHQRGRKSLKKSIQKYNKIVLFDIPLILVRLVVFSGCVVRVNPDLQTSSVAIVSLIKHARPSQTLSPKEPDRGPYTEYTVLSAVANREYSHLPQFFRTILKTKATTVND